MLHDAAVLGAFTLALVIAWFVTHTVRDWMDWRSSIGRMKGNRSVFFGGLPRALIMVAIGLAVLRTLF